MKFDLIWKNIDNEITKEEKALLNDAFLNDDSLITYRNQAAQLDTWLSKKFSHQMDANFMSLLKANILDELSISELKIRNYPAIIFAVFSFLMFFAYYFSTDLKIGFSLGDTSSSYYSYFVILMSISIGGMILYGLDNWMKSKMLNKPRHS